MKNLMEDPWIKRFCRFNEVLPKTRLYFFSVVIKRNVETQRKTSVSSDSCCLLTRTLWTIVPPLWCFMLFTQIMGPRNCKTRENIKFAILQRARSLAKSGWLSQMVLAYFRDLFAPLSFWEYCGGLNASFQSIKKCHAKNLSSIPWTLQSSWSLKYVLFEKFY